MYDTMIQTDQDLVLDPHKHLSVTLQSSIIHNSQNVETTQTPVPA